MFQNLSLARALQYLPFRLFLHRLKYRLIHRQQIKRAGLNIVHFDIFQIHAQDFHRRQTDNYLVVHNIDIVRAQLVQIQTGQHLTAHNKNTALRILPQPAPIPFFLRTDNRIDIKCRTFQAVHLLNLHQNPLTGQNLMFFVLTMQGIKPAARSRQRTQHQHDQSAPKHFHFKHPPLK